MHLVQKMLQSVLHALLSPNLYPLSRTWKATPRICSVFLLSLPLCLRRGGPTCDVGQSSTALHPDHTPQHNTRAVTPHTHTFRRTLMNRCLYLSQLCCNAGLERIGTAHYPKVHLVHLLYSAKLLYNLIWVLKCSLMHRGFRWMKISSEGWR